MLPKSAAFLPHAAFFAALDPDGSVVVREFNDPETVIVVVAEFEVQGDDYTAIYHEDIDKWEVTVDDTDEFYQLADRANSFYEFAEATVDFFRDALLSGPGPGRLARKLTREIRNEIDAEIIRDLRIASGLSTPPPVAIPKLPLGAVPNYKMKATWSVEAEQDLKAMHSVKYVCKSRLVSKKTSAHCIVEPT